jgi:alkanesulfonate monooxygenase SsuD/methylene tetrahydromethanopterin reductase-like flavin-dependent oxidoreductase (luciferase family)
MRYAVGLPNVGEFGDPRVLLDLAVLAERHGWDGLNIWDHVLYHEPDWAVTSSMVAAAAIAAATSRLRILLTVALPRRQVQDVARDTAAVAALSGRRLTVIAVIGSMDREYSDFGLDPRGRGHALDARLAQLSDLWRQWSAPPIAIWCGGRWPHQAGLRRAGRFDGAMPTFSGQRDRNAPVEQVSQAIAVVRSQAGRPVDIAVEGATDGRSDADQPEAYAAAGVTWWIEALGWWRGGSQAAAARIAAGPPSVSPPG